MRGTAAPPYVASLVAISATAVNPLMPSASFARSMDAIRALNSPGLEQSPPADTGGRATPVMEQYIEIKAANPDCLLFYRMGDFYELFFDDAEVAARTLGIVLTKRGKHLGRDIPMCGVPVHRADEYLQRLIMAGHRVAVCEQLEDPAEARRRGAKSVVRRDVTRLVTPGTLTEDTLLDPRRNNYLLAIARARASSAAESRFALAWIDISTGEFRLAERDRASLVAEIARLEPSEVIVSDALYGDAELAPYLRSLPAVRPLTRDVFDGSTAEHRLAGYFGLSTTEGFGALSRLELTAAAACVSYVERTQLGHHPPLSPPMRESEGSTLLIDQATRSNLELARTLSGERRGSLLAAVDRSVTAAGSRLLAQQSGGATMRLNFL
jgi:DNA mismatch repair protein MutS